MGGFKHRDGLAKESPVILIRFLRHILNMASLLSRDVRRIHNFVMQKKITR